MSPAVGKPMGEWQNFWQALLGEFVVEIIVGAILSLLSLPIAILRAKLGLPKGEISGEFEFGELPYLLVVMVAMIGCAFTAVSIPVHLGRASHPIRLTMIMLLGSWVLYLLFSGVVGFAAQEIISAIKGGLTASRNMERRRVYGCHVLAKVALFIFWTGFSLLLVPASRSAVPHILIWSYASFLAVDGKAFTSILLVD